MAIYTSSHSSSARRPTTTTIHNYNNNIPNSVRIDNVIVSRFDNGIKIQSISFLQKIAAQRGQIFDPNIYQIITTGSRINNNHLISLLATGEINFQQLLVLNI